MTASQTTNGSTASAWNIHTQKTWFGHPRGLFYLFFTEMWERFSYYGMRALLVLYMIQHLFIEVEKGKEVLGFNAVKGFLEGMFGPLQNQALSSQIYGLYTAFVYFTPLFGGLLADRILGQRKTVYIGATLMMIGHFLMASEALFFPALMLLILGNGAFKPNISTQVGLLYEEGDPRRDSAYTIFYMGVNLGGLLAPLGCGTLGEKFGWHWGFGLAGVGMGLGMWVYSRGKRHLPPDRVTQKRVGTLERKDEPLSKEDWHRVIALVLLCIVNICFWGVFEQQGNTLQLWSSQNTDWRFLGFDVPSTWYQSFNSAFILMFAPLLLKLWKSQNKKGKEPSSVAKMGIGCFLSGIAFIVMIVAAKAVAPDEKGSLMWLAGTTWLFTIGELYLSPIGLSLVSRVSPPRIVSMMMGMWYLSNFFGNYVAGFIGSFYERLPKDAFFGIIAALGIGAGLIFLAAHKPLSKLVGKGA